jgi:phosphate transport system protein
MGRDHYEQQLHELQAALLRLASLVESAINRSIQALKRQDVELARQIIADDDLIDAGQYELEEQALTLIARQQPLARDQRANSAAISIASELERMGDYAEGIAEITIRGADQPLLKPLIDIPRMADLALEMLHQSLDAYLRHDADLARNLGGADTQVDELTTQVQNELIGLMVMEPKNIERAIHLLYIAHNLERIADRATNIGERVVFVVTGEIVDLNT